MQPLSPDEELPNYDAVFSGKVTDIEETNPDDQMFSSADSILVTLDVDTVWKGDKQETITVKTAQSSASCGFYFENNQEYIVYAAQYNGEEEGDQLEVSLCSRTNLLSNATEDLQELGPGFSVKSETPSELLLSPLKQFKNGTPSEQVQCKEGLHRIIKHDNTPACVKTSTMEKIVERGWGIISDQTISNDDLSSKISPSEVISNTINANNQFALNFYSDIAKDNQENIFFSPWSISTAAAIVYEGARGNTAEEMGDVFGFIKDKQKRQEGFKSVNDDLNQKDSRYDLTVANALWLDQEFQPHEEYVDIATRYYDSKVSTVDFDSNGVDVINDWVKEETKEKIEELFPPGPRPNVLLGITNAVYFKGTWTTQFDPEKTQDDGQFWINPDEFVTVPMMFVDESQVKVGWSEKARILDMPYEGDKLSMMILLPEQKDGLNELEESLSIENLSEWKNSLQEVSTSVIMPKFKLETDYDLTSVLKNLGMTDAFGPADFSGISDNDLYISEAMHKAFVDVNEEGTEAAAATGFMMEESASIPFRVDHPFIFIILDNDTENILFIGRMINPAT